MSAGDVRACCGGVVVGPHAVASAAASRPGCGAAPRSDEFPGFPIPLGDRHGRPLGGICRCRPGRRGGLRRPGRSGCPRTSVGTHFLRQASRADVSSARGHLRVASKAARSITASTPIDVAMPRVETPTRYAELLIDAGCSVDVWETTAIGKTGVNLRRRSAYWADRDLERRGEVNRRGRGQI